MPMTELTDFEIKASAAPGAVDGRLGELLGAFEEFKRSNDERLAELERRGAVDPLTEDKLTRLNATLDGAKAALDRASLERARPRLEGLDARITGSDEYKDAFSAYVKRGEEKALSIGSGPDGGYLVPSETETEITRLLTEVSPIRSIAGIRQVSTSLYKKPVTIAGTA